MLWHTAWLNGLLDGAFFWIGDARRESALPSNWNGDVIARYERLSEALSTMPCEQAAVSIDPLTACGQEAFALAAALTVDAPIILTAAHADREQPPLICCEAAGIANITVHGPPEWEPAADWTERIVPGNGAAAHEPARASAHAHRRGPHLRARRGVAVAAAARRRRPATASAPSRTASDGRGAARTSSGMSSPDGGHW